MGLAKHDGVFEAAEDATIDASELIDALRQSSQPKLGNRNAAVANCLSGQEGWRDEATRLGGAFATIGRATGLTNGKE